MMSGQAVFFLLLSFSFLHIYMIHQYASMTMVPIAVDELGDHYIWCKGSLPAKDSHSFDPTFELPYLT